MSKPANINFVMVAGLGHHFKSITTTVNVSIVAHFARSEIGPDNCPTVTSDTFARRNNSRVRKKCIQFAQNQVKCEMDHNCINLRIHSACTPPVRNPFQGRQKGQPTRNGISRAPGAVNRIRINTKRSTESRISFCLSKSH
jgi:hypothetical protein